MAETSPMESHLHNVARFIRQGVLVPFLGAGVNACGQAPSAFKVGERFPSGTELAEYLATTFRYDGRSTTDLARIAQHVAITLGEASLYRELHNVFDTDVAPNALHHLLAALPEVARQEPPVVHPLIVTTNYDDALERAFHMAGEEFDTVIYIAHGRNCGKLLHRDPGGKVTLVRTPNKYAEISLAERPVIVKIHGAVDRNGEFTEDNYVITEDHYIEYLMQTDIKKLIPVGLAKKVTESHFLFLGYSLRDWNLRVILHRLWGEQSLENVSWAVQLDPDPTDTKFWARRDVEILQQDLDSYVAGLQAALGLGSAAT